MEINIKEMTIKQKIQAMELLWDDFCRNKPDFQSPAWHEEILKERQNSIKEGKDSFIDWNQAKKDIWKSIS